MIINFTKMHSLGNDFVIIDLLTQSCKLQMHHIQKIADRHFGIGCDQVILLEPPIRKEADFFYRIFNPDGLEAEQCGNGARCAARCLLDLGLANKSELVADCLGGAVILSVEDTYSISASLQQVIPKIDKKNLEYDELPSEIHCLSVGNPHGVCIVNDLESTPMEKWGNSLSTLTDDNGINVGFMQIISRDEINLRVYERGAGLTLACGSGACAAVLVGQSLDKLNNRVVVHFPYGELAVTYQEQQQILRMTGTVRSSFMGRFRI